MNIVGPVGNFVRASLKYAESGFSNVDDITYNHRTFICSQCEKNNDGICTECSCIIKIKAKWATENCPLGKWPNDITPSFTPSPTVNVGSCGECITGK